jgi:hypothetical protein
MQISFKKKIWSCPREIANSAILGERLSAPKSELVLTIHIKCAEPFANDQSEQQTRIDILLQTWPRHKPLIQNALRLVLKQASCDLQF